MGDKNVHPDGAKHTPGKNDGLPSSPAAISRRASKRAESKRLQTEALEMRRSGYSYREIAAHQNCAVTTAATRVTKAIRREVPQELIDSTRAIELDRIDQMTKMALALMEKAYLAGDTETYFKAQDRVNALHDRRVKIVPIQQPVRLTIDQQITTNDQDRELIDLIGKEAVKVQDQLNVLNNLDTIRDHRPYLDDQR